MCLSYHLSPTQQTQSTQGHSRLYFFSIEPARYFGYKKVVARILLSLMMGYENHTIHVDDGKASSILPHLICCDGATELHTRRWDFKERVSLPTATRCAFFQIP